MTAKEALYKLLRIALGNDNDLSLPADVSLNEVMEISEKVGINGLALSGLQKLTDSGFDLATIAREDKKRLTTWIGLSLKMEHKAALQWKAIQDLVALYAQNGITTVGLKGMTVAQWYPNPMLRDSCDFDCFLLKAEADGKVGFGYEEGNEIVEVNRVHVDRRIYVHSIFRYHEVTVENHHYLSAVKLSKRHRELDSFLRSLLLTEPLQTVLGTHLMTGSPMFNAVFLTLHAHRHMLNERMPLKLLTDWALFIKNNKTLDWNLFWKNVEGFGMLRFAQSMTRLSCNLLGVSVPFSLPVDDEADDLLETSMWDFPQKKHKRKSLFRRRLGMISLLMRARKKYKFFYDCSSFQMIMSYVKGFFFGRDE